MCSLHQAGAINKETPLSTNQEPDHDEVLEAMLAEEITSIVRDGDTFALVIDTEDMSEFEEESE